MDKLLITLAAVLMTLMVLLSGCTTVSYYEDVDTVPTHACTCDHHLGNHLGCEKAGHAQVCGYGHCYR